MKVEVGGEVTLVYQPARRILHLNLQDESGRPHEVDYTLQELVYDGTQKEKLAEPIHGFAFEGVLHEELPASVTKLKLVLEDDKDNPIDLELGRLDPVSTTRGLKARLQNLGLYQGELDDKFDGPTASALRMFQRSQSLPVTGQADPITRGTLTKVHGS
ncbi:MAG: peptidoglycan-binding domain-containing protein [Myxococcales bacterium]